MWVQTRWRTTSAYVTLKNLSVVKSSWWRVSLTKNSKYFSFLLYLVWLTSSWNERRPTRRHYKVIYPTGKLFRSSIDPWAQCPLVLTTHPTNFLHSILDCAEVLAECMSIWHHSLISSSHSLLCLPWIPVPSTRPNTTYCFSAMSCSFCIRAQRS